MERPTVVIELEQTPQLARDISAGGVFVPGCDLRINTDCTLLVRGPTEEIELPARVVYVDAATGAGFELVGYTPALREHLERLMTTWVTGLELGMSANAAPERGVQTRDATDDANEAASDERERAGDASERAGDESEYASEWAGDASERAGDANEYASERANDESEHASKRASQAANDESGHAGKRTNEAASDDSERARDESEYESEYAHDMSGAESNISAHATDIERDDEHAGEADEPIALDLDPIDGEPPELTDEEEADPTKRKRALNLHERLRGLTIAQQIKLAQTGDPQERILLERYYNKAVWEPLLRNPRLTPPEVARIARMGTLPRVLLEVIVNNGGWLQVPEIRRALLANPRLGTDQILRVLRMLPKHELKLASTQTAYPYSVRDAAKRLIKDAGGGG